MVGHLAGSQGTRVRFPIGPLKCFIDKVSEELDNIVITKLQASLILKL